MRAGLNSVGCGKLIRTLLALMATYARRWLNEPTLGRFPQRLQLILNSRQFVSPRRDIARR